MIDHDPSHYSKMIISSQYSYFFEDLAQSQQGSEITIEKGGDVLSAEIYGEQIVLLGLTYNRSTKGESVVVTTNHSDNPEYPISFILVWAVFDQNDKVVAVELSDEHNRKVVMRFGSK